MAVKRGKSQARRTGGGGTPLPGWAWLIIGVLLTIVVVLAAPKLLESDGEPWTAQIFIDTHRPLCA